MPLNEGAIDRGLRVVLGAALLSLVFRGTIGMWGWVGAVLILTGVASYCPLYHVLGWSTCGRDERATVQESSDQVV